MFKTIEGTLQLNSLTFTFFLFPFSCNSYLITYYSLPSLNLLRPTHSMKKYFPFYI